MSWKNVDSAQVPAETPLYRINDFFSVADLVVNGRLFVPSAAAFIDANEGIERLLLTLDVATGFCGGALGGFPSGARVKAFHRWHKESHYVSCWTRTMESVAMWGLYSQDFCGVQIATTAGDLAQAGAQYSQQFGANLSSLARAKEDDVLITRYSLVPVEYESLLKTHHRIERRGKAIAKLRGRGKVRSLEPGELRQLSERDAARERVYLVAPFSLKDESFAHESEVRLVLRATRVAGNGLARATEIANLEDPLPAHAHTAIHHLELWAEEKLLPVPQSAYVALPSGFVREVRIDPRCPPHKRAFMEDFFKSAGIPVRPSHCFGYLPDSAEFRDPRYRT